MELVVGQDGICRVKSTDRDFLLAVIKDLHNGNLFDKDTGNLITSVQFVGTTEDLTQTD